MSPASRVKILLVAICFNGLAACDKRQLGEAALAPCLDSGLTGQSIVIEGGEFTYGDSRFYPEERPVKQVKVNSFEIDSTEVTNAQFKEFVKATGYATDAEKGLSEELFPDVPAKFRRPGSAVFIAPVQDSSASTEGRWQFVPGASWRNPHGPASSIKGKEHYPVVHVTYSDAMAYASWMGRRLPTEVEWEFAARGGHVGGIFAWGDEPPHSGEPKTNTWQGRFPYQDHALDGYLGAAPVGCFAANDFGLYDITGNLWEWTQTAYHADRTMEYRRDGYDPRQPGVKLKTIKGGSFLCSDNYCQRYRPAARQGQDVTLATSHIGFRTAADIDDSSPSL